MKPVEVHLLESLGAGVRPFDVGEAELPDTNPDFDLMLADAIDGNPKSDLAVLFAPSVSGEFTHDEQGAIRSAIDQAAVAGVDRALILHNKRTLRVDVQQRIVLEAIPIEESGVIEEIDGFVATNQPSNDDEQDENEVSEIRGDGVLIPARIVRNASLVHALAGRVPTL
ncbi:MAG: hypothetical protein P1U42_09440 [Phycisphaerales bacterium]|jgi:hypothetical protein|nr:hypothetical protein [Phycisphaerales bacterium]